MFFFPARIELAWWVDHKIWDVRSGGGWVGSSFEVKNVIKFLKFNTEFKVIYKVKHFLIFILHYWSGSLKRLSASFVRRALRIFSKEGQICTKKYPRKQLKSFRRITFLGDKILWSVKILKTKLNHETTQVQIIWSRIPRIYPFLYFFMFSLIRGSSIKTF